MSSIHNNLQHSLIVCCCTKLLNCFAIIKRLYLCINGGWWMVENHINLLDINLLCGNIIEPRQNNVSPTVSYNIKSYNN